MFSKVRLHPVSYPLSFDMNARMCTGNSTKVYYIFRDQTEQTVKKSAHYKNCARIKMYFRIEMLLRCRYLLFIVWILSTTTPHSLSLYFLAGNEIVSFGNVRLKQIIYLVYTHSGRERVGCKERKQFIVKFILMHLVWNGWWFYFILVFVAHCVWNRKALHQNV